jgi:hypothetical protein
VTEVLASGSEVIPATVKDAVLSRAMRLSPSARQLLEAAAVVPQRAELWLLQALGSAVSSVGSAPWRQPAQKPLGLGPTPMALLRSRGWRRRSR